MRTIRSLTGPLLCLLERSLSAGITGSGRDVTFSGSPSFTGAFGGVAGLGAPLVTGLVFAGSFAPLVALGGIDFTGVAVGTDAALGTDPFDGSGCGMREVDLLATGLAGRGGLAVDVVPAFNVWGRLTGFDLFFIADTRSDGAIRLGGQQFGWHPCMGNRQESFLQRRSSGSRVGATPTGSRRHYY